MVYEKRYSCYRIKQNYDCLYDVYAVDSFLLWEMEIKIKTNCHSLPEAERAVEENKEYLRKLWYQSKLIKEIPANDD